MIVRASDLHLFLGAGKTPRVEGRFWFIAVRLDTLGSGSFPGQMTRRNDTAGDEQKH